MDAEVWHERGCERIGTITTDIQIAMDLGEGWWRHTDCRCLLAGTSPDQDKAVTMQDWASPTTMLRRQSRVFRHVEDPRFAQEDAQARQDRLDGWLVAILALPDRTTRAAVLDSVTAHMARHGEVP